MRAVVTAGGTSEPIDDVRVVTNLSTGRFGARIAAALQRRGIDVTLIGSHALLSHPERVPDGVETVPFGTFAELRDALFSAASGADFVFMAAAVSDYSPVPSEGKIRSTLDELVVRMTLNPKLLTQLRDHCDGTLVGFKLLSGVGEEELRQTAVKQIRKARLDYCVANDLQYIRDGRHPILLVTGDDTATPITGSKAETAEQLVADILRRQSAGGDGETLLRDQLGVSSLVRVPRGIALDVPRTSRVWPAGSAEEAHAVLAVLGEAAVAGTWDGGPFVVDLAGQALLLGDVDAPTTVFRGRQAIGTASGAPLALSIADSIDRDDVAATLRRPVKTPDAEWWTERGWRADGELVHPPCDRSDVREAASVCLVDPLRHEVLIGRRKTSPWMGFWAFPGGHREGDETLFQTALRELQEETGIEVGGEPVATREIWVSAGPGSHAVHVTNFTVYVYDRPEPAETDEIDARWVPLHEAATLCTPMAAGTSRILRQVCATVER